jgi:phenylacetic acid degradation operon negative regulatory protein
MRARRVDYAELLDLFVWGVDKLTRPTLHNLLAGYEEYAHRSDRRGWLKRLEEQKLVERTGRGKRAQFTITGVGRQRMSTLEPWDFWGRQWDRAWRVVTFDLPETRRHDRKLLWQALRARKLGLLQRSVWVWPHDVQAILAEIIKVEGLPECFCGFEARQLFLCTDAEIVATAWDWEEIGHRQAAYLNHLVATVRSLDAARDLARLAAVARIERQAYEHAFIFDPLLPAALLPKDYDGRAVHDRHVRFRDRLRQRFVDLAAKENLP